MTARRTDAGRVIAGSARSIRLAAPGTGTRPLADRVKQTLFAILEPDLPGARVLDLFAGSGAAGIEALSRGARSATFVERDRGAVTVVAANLERTHLADRGQVVRAEVMTFLKGLPAETDSRWDVILVDPPYDDGASLPALLAALEPHLASTGWLVVKHFWRVSLPIQVGLLASVRGRRFGETALTFYRLTGVGGPRRTATETAGATETAAATEVR